MNREISFKEMNDAPPQYNADEATAWACGWEAGYRAALDPEGERLVE